MKNVLVPIAKGFEEIELVSIVDTLRRAELRAIMASLDMHKRVLGAHNIVIEADTALPECEMGDFEAIALAGGYNGMLNLANNELIIQWLKAFKRDSKLIAAICASPIVLDKAGVLDGDFTCYPSCEADINMQGKTRSDSAVVKNGNVITSIGPATGVIFALSIVETLCGKDIAQSLYQSMQMPSLKDYLSTIA